MVMRYKIVYPDELNHHGVKGMKWGVRKQKPKMNSYVSAGYRTDGTRDYKISRKDVNKHKSIKQQANNIMTRVYGSNWNKRKDGKELYETIIGEIEEEQEYGVPSEFLGPYSTIRKK